MRGNAARPNGRWILTLKTSHFSLREFPMAATQPVLADPKAKEQILGYLTFSSGAEDANFIRNLDRLFAEHAGTCSEGPKSDSQANWLASRSLEWLIDECQRLADCDSCKINDADQAVAVLQLTQQHVLPGYLDHHRDLLFHQDKNFLFSSFFVARVIQKILQTGPPWNEIERVVGETIASLNDFLGHRPVATLESQNIEPYEHEWIAPVPVYLQSAGTGFGPYQELLDVALDTIRNTDPVILRQAQFSMDQMKELDIDPRAFDFDHPINKRPNHHFGQWDEHAIDNSGNFYRFILQQVTLDALLDRVHRKMESEGADDQLKSELMNEAGAVLGCTMLMASGICGSRPGAFDSNTTLSTLLPTIAGYRDQFYRDLIERLPEAHRNRLRSEAEARRQPFGAARQNLNHLLSKRRASQLVNCRLATIFARMGFCEAATKQSQIVPVAAARILCQIDCLLSSAQQATRKKQLVTAYEYIPRLVQLLKDGVNCGAIVDPWNILGFDANYSLFPASENSVPDHRVYELVDLIERVLGMCSLIWSEAAASNDSETCTAIKQEFEHIVDWWRKYAAHEVMAVDAVDPEEIYSAAELVARALNLWHRGGAAAGDIEFWKQHAALFDSPKAYQLVIEALMDRGDYQTSSALLVHWLSQAEFVRLQHGGSSFHNLIWRWIIEQRERLRVSDFEQRNEIWNRIRKFYDFIEANAEQYGEIPDFQIGRVVKRPIDQEPNLDDELDDSEPGPDTYDTAYDEEFTYIDTTDDGNEGSIFDPGADQTDEELEAEVDRVLDRLEFLATSANFWKIAATVPLPVDNRKQLNETAIKQLKNRRDILAGWIHRADYIRTSLKQLLHSVAGYKIPTGGLDAESLTRYDRQRLYKESLLERIVETCVAAEISVGMLAAVIGAIDNLVEDKSLDELRDGRASNGPLLPLFSAILLTDLKLVRSHFPDAIEYLHSQPLLYVPLDREGKPADIVAARVLQEQIRDLAGCLPILGLFIETHELVTTALAMERNQKTAKGAVTEFDNLFKVAYTSMVKCLVQSTQLLQQKIENSAEFDESEAARESEEILFDCIEMVTESMSALWLKHSETLRLSVLERVNDAKSWEQLVGFIKRYGQGLFTQQFLQLSNARAILHQGVGQWLDNVRESPNALDLRLFDELDTGISKQRTTKYLTLVLQAVCENYHEFRDYNTTTTQSDQGELLYTMFDFIRLRNRYDRVCWYLKPIVWGHEILVRDGQNSVARMWRRSLTEQIGTEADRYLEILETLRNKYSMQMESVGRRLEGKFVHEMQIDRLRSLVSPAMSNPDSRKSQRSFDKLQQETQAFTRATPGVGVDLPAWLAALENEVAQFHLPLRLRSRSNEQALIRPIDIPVSRLREQLEQLPRK